METTDIYVVCNVWLDGRTVVVGAAAALDDAQTIAKRHGAGVRWKPWAEVDDAWVHPADLADAGAPVEQRIVRVPLAGAHKLAAARVSDPWHGRPNAPDAAGPGEVSWVWFGLC